MSVRAVWTTVRDMAYEGKKDTTVLLPGEGAISGFIDFNFE